MFETELRRLPSVDRILKDRRIGELDADGIAPAIARQVLDDIRARIANGEPAPAWDDIIGEVALSVAAALSPALVSLINATGVILHTNLGRAPLAQEAIDAMDSASRGYSNLEFDIASGKRSSRHFILEPLLTRLTGAEAAMAVNNNASAVLLTLSALAAGREVVLSRGQLVEIGGGFRIPDVMRQSRAKLVEVGTTNRTRASDYDAAITLKTAALMRVHTSNFKVTGFTESTRLKDLARLARRHNLLLIDDIGSGCMLDTTKYQLPPEPTPQASVAAGADIVLFSGDKLLGGPQGGLVVGRRDLIEKMKRHPLARAMRLDKASIAGLAATLTLYLRGDAESKIPIWRMIGQPIADLDRRARAIASRCSGAHVIDGRSMIGGGSLPDESLPTRLVALEGTPGSGATRLAARLRARHIVARVEDGRVLLDPRTIDPKDDELVAETLATVR